MVSNRGRSLQYLLRSINRPENLFARTATKSITVALFGIFVKAELINNLSGFAYG